jgi:hypothetical protein
MVYLKLFEDFIEYQKFFKLFEDFNFPEFSEFYNGVKKLEQSKLIFGEDNFEFDITKMNDIIDIENNLLKYQKGKHTLRSKPSNFFGLKDSTKSEIITIYIKAFVIKDNITFEEKRGENSHKLFNTGLHDKDRGTFNLGGDCMGVPESQDCFDILTKNPNKISVIYSFRKGVSSKKNVSGFTILFNVDGQIYYDRIYGYNKEDAVLLELECVKRGYQNIYDKGYFTSNDDLMKNFYIPKKKLGIQLENWKFKKYPYFDSFRFLDIKTGMLYNYLKDIKLYKLSDSDSKGRLFDFELDNYINPSDLYNNKTRKKIKRCIKCLNSENFPFIKFDDKGVCNYCNNQ